MAKVNDTITWKFVPGIPAAGTTSQVLAKTTSTDYDATWVTPAAGGGAADGVGGKLYLYANYK